MPINVEEDNKKQDQDLKNKSHYKKVQRKIEFF